MPVYYKGIRKYIQKLKEILFKAKKWDLLFNPIYKLLEHIYRMQYKDKMNVTLWNRMSIIICNTVIFRLFQDKTRPTAH